MKTRTIKSPKYGIFEIQLDDDIYEELKNKKIFLKKIKTGKFYAAISFNGKQTLLHRYILKPQQGEIIDHIDRNPLNNTRQNLRIATFQLNSLNRNMQKNNTSGVVGVSYAKDRNKWTSQIKVNNKTISLGHFLKKEDAIKVRKEAELLYFGFNLQKGVIITKQGNQFYLEFQIEDENGALLDTASILKVQFVIGDLVKTYDGVGNEVIYDNLNKVFKVWVTEEETFKFDKQVKMDARILFKGEENYRPIGGTYIETNYWYDSLKEVSLDV